MFDRQRTYRSELTEWRTVQTDEANKIAVWTTIRDIIFTARRQDWGLDVQGRDAALNELPTVNDLIGELTTETGLDRPMESQIRDYLLLNEEYQGDSEFITYGVHLSELRVEMMDAASALTEALSGPVTHEGRTVNFPVEFEQDQNYARRLAVINEALSGMGFASAGERFIADLFVDAYLDDEPAFDPFDLLSPRAVDLVGPSGDVDAVEQALVDPNVGIASSEAVSRETVGQLCLFLTHLLPGLLRLFEKENVSDELIANVATNVMGRFFALLFGNDQEFEGIDGPISYVEFDLDPYLDDDGIASDLHKQNLEDVKAELAEMLLTLRNTREVITPNLLPNDESGSFTDGLKVGGKTASFVDTIAKGGGFASHRITSSIAYVFACFSLCASVFENGSLELSMDHNWDMNQWLGLFKNVQSVIDFNAVTELIQKGVLDEGADAKPLFLDTNSGSGSKSLSSIRKIQIASKLAEPVFAVFDLVNAGYGMSSASDAGDTSVFVGHTIAGAGAMTALAVSLYAVNAARVASAPFLVALASSNPLGWVATAGLVVVSVVAWALIEFTQDHPLSIWLRNTVFGVNYDVDRTYTDPEKPTFRFNDGTPLGQERDDTAREINYGRMVSEYFSLTHPLGFKQHGATITHSEGDEPGVWKGVLESEIPVPDEAMLLIYPMYDVGTTSSRYHVGLETPATEEHWFHAVLLRQSFGSSREVETVGNYEIVDENQLRCPNLKYEIDHRDDWALQIEFYSDSIEQIFGYNEQFFTGPLSGNHFLELVICDDRVWEHVRRLHAESDLTAAEAEEAVINRAPVVRRERVPITYDP